MKHRNTIKLILLGALLLFVVSSMALVLLWSFQAEGLKEGRVGYDTCTYCGMTLAEQKYNVSILVKDKNNHEQTLHYDDIGCFFRHVKNEKIKYIEGVVYDFDSLRPVPIEEAFFEKTQQQTPMGSGWISHEEANDNSRQIKEIL